MAVCCPRGGEHASDDGRGSKTCFSPCPEGQALRPTGLLTSGSHACGLLPRRRTFRSLASSGFVPGASPVTVAGAVRDSHPLPLVERIQRAEKRLILEAPNGACQASSRSEF